MDQSILRRNATQESHLGALRETVQKTHNRKPTHSLSKNPRGTLGHSKYPIGSIHGLGIVSGLSQRSPEDERYTSND